MALGKFLKGIAGDLKKGAKGSKEYQAEKAKRKAKRAKSPLGKAAKSVSEDIKRGLKGSKEYQAEKAKRKAVKAKKKEGKTWTKAVKKQKKAGGESLSSLVGKRKGLKKGTAEYAKVQNAINKAYGSKKVHKATTESRKPAAPKPKPKSIDMPKKDIGQSYEQETAEVSFKGGGKVESNPYGWPSKDSRNR